MPVLTPDVEALPGWGADLTRRVAQQVATLAAPAGRHRLVSVPAGPEILDALHDVPVRLSTMGRGLDADPAAFVAAAVAGVHAESLRPA